jgi:hypothetical protein
LKVLALALVACALAIPIAAAASQTPVPAQPWKKTCDFGVHGGEGCVVTIELRKGPQGDCPNANYCILLKVVCPANNPPGDPGETCSQEFCGNCDNSAAPVSIGCDGVDFEVKPKAGKDWGGVAADCGNAEVTASKP